MRNLFRVAKPYRKYVRLKKKGVEAEEMYRLAEADGLDWFSRLAMLKEVYGCSLLDAKEISTQAEGRRESLRDHQERLLPALRMALDEIEDEPNPDKGGGDQ